MRLFLSAVLFAILLSGAGAAAIEQPGVDLTNPVPVPKPKNDSKWNVRVELLMVAMPQEKALALLPDLRDPQKIDAATEKVLSAIEQKQASLMGYPVACGLSGERILSEAIQEIRYPSEFEPPQVSTTTSPATPIPAAAGTECQLSTLDATPNAFETRNTGVTLEVLPEVSPKGDWILLDMVPQRVVLLNMETITIKGGSGRSIRLQQPRFAQYKTTASLKVRNGARLLLSVNLLPEPEHQIEFFILQAWATSIE